MLKDRRLTGLLWIIILSCSAQAQTNTDSPYTRFGLGQLTQPGFEKSRAMGGAGLAFRSNNQLNYLNPASYSEQDSMSFLFDFGLMGTYVQYEAGDLQNTYFGGNLDHLALGFPITRWWFASVGVMPYSKVGYSIKEEGFEPDIGFVDYVYSGNGGLNQLYLGTAVKPFRNFSIGANFKYIFGFIDLTRTVDFPLENTYSRPNIESNTLINDFIIDLGLQYQQALGEKSKLTLGLIFDNKSSLKAENKVTIRNVFPGESVAINDSTILSPDFLISQVTQKGNIVIPNNIGAGLSFEYNQRFEVGLDYYQQDWTNSSFFNEKEPLAKSNSVHGGLQVIPNPEALRGYHKRIAYRLGGHYINSYLRLEGEQLKDYGISFGVGLPLRNAKSSFNLACELGRRGTLENNLIRENYMFLSFSVTLHDIWFYKRKFD